MSVDMFERRFREELCKVTPFQLIGAYNRQVRLHDFPAWRALFTSQCLHGHSTGYRLFSYDDFFQYCERAYCQHHPEAQRFRPYFTGALLPGTQYRIGGWYESGMAEVYLYVCLVEAIEDKLKEGIVLYDPRVDWKLKADLLVTMKGRTIIVNSHDGAAEHRPGVEQQRDRVERERKINAAESSHWGNHELERIPKLEITRTAADCQLVNGVRLFSLPAINRLLGELYAICGIPGGYFFTG